MGAKPSGLITFTLYQRNTPPITWLCFAATVTSHGDDVIRTVSPFGAGSESDVLISRLTIRPGQAYYISVSCTFDNRYAIEADLHANVSGQLQQFSGQESWSRVYPGPNGPRVLLIETRDAQMEQADMEALLGTAAH